jgi:hypothetical protein
MPVLKLLIKEIKEKGILIHNEPDIYGSQPVFLAQSSPAVLLFLESFQDLELLRKKNGYLLLYQCIHNHIANAEVINALRGQLNIGWVGITSISLGKHLDMTSLGTKLQNLSEQGYLHLLCLIGYCFTGVNAPKQSPSIPIPSSQSKTNTDNMVLYHFRLEPK